MTDQPKGKDSAQTGATSEYFAVGNPLHAVRASYVRRQADDLLFETLSSGGNAHIVAPDRSGKSSLIAATTARLQASGFKVAVVDLAQISERDGGTDAGRWYYNIAYRLSRQLRLKTDLQEWWQDKSMLSNRQRLVEFYIEVLLSSIQERIVVFVDSIQYIAELPFDEQLLASIRAAHNARATDPEFTRLSFVLLGETDPSLLVTHEGLSPFQVSQQIRLNDFSRDEINSYRTELNLPLTAADKALDRIYDWTSGQPYLVQKLARAVSREDVAGDIEGNVDRIAIAQLAGKAALNSEPHLAHLQRSVMNDPKDCEPMLNLYGKIRKGVDVIFDPESRIHRKLLAVGLLVVGAEGKLVPRNRVYGAVFTARWANENLPLHWRGPSIAVAVVIAILVVPFWYTQVLPSSHIDMLTSGTADLPDVATAYENLRTFPGHADSADSLYAMTLRQRAMQAGEATEIDRIATYARRLPDGDTFADSLAADFWNRRMWAAMKAEDRDAALLASIEGLVVPTPLQRRIAASLVGDDYPNLVGTIGLQTGDRIMFDADNRLLSFVTGSRVAQWSAATDRLQQRAPWTLTALEVTPLVRRLAIAGSGSVQRIEMQMTLRHERPDDVKARMIAPSGRTVELDFAQAVQREDGSRAFDAGILSALVGESIDGTWSLSIRDEAAVAAGSLAAWSLRINGTMHEDIPDRPLVVPDPVARESSELWFSPEGRYAVARASNSDSARLWDLLYAQAARTIAVPADERVLGLSAAADYLVTARLDSINLWRIANGRRYSVISVGSASATPVLSDDGRFLSLLERSENEAHFELWSVETGERLSAATLAGSVALTDLSADGRLLAAGDYDQTVRVWDLDSSRQIAQIDLPVQPTEIHLSRTGSRVAVVYGEQGWAFWDITKPAQPLYADYGEGRWAVKFSQSGSRLLAGNSRDGYQVVRSADGNVAGPVFVNESAAEGQTLLAFSQDEALVVTANTAGATRFWRAPTYQVLNTSIPSSETRVASSDVVTAIAQGARRIAVGDGEGHVHVVDASDPGSGRPDDPGDIAFIGHTNAVTRLTFSNDSSLVASADASGDIRIWDTHSGMPRTYRIGAPQPDIQRLRFSPSGALLAVLTQQRLLIVDTSGGVTLAEFEINAPHPDLAFANDELLYMASVSGELHSIGSDRTENWAMRTAWQGEKPLRNVAVSPLRGHVVIVDEDNVASLLNPVDGTIGAARLALPNRVSDIAFGGSETRILFRTGRWVHRASIAPGGIVWQDALRAPKAVPGSRLVVELNENGMLDPLGERIAVMTRDSGSNEVVGLQFEPVTGNTVIGPREQLREYWRARLGYSQENGQ